MQYLLITMIQKKCGQGGLCVALLTDLCKDFDCIVYDFLLGKIEAYAFFYEALKVIHG